MHSIHQSSIASTPQGASAPHASAANTQSLEGNYLLERWLPLLGPDKYALVCVLRNQCYQDPATDELVTECSLDLADLAAKIGKSRATVCRLLQRNAEGMIVEPQPNGPPIPSLLNHFIQVLPQQRYSQQHGRRVQAVNRFKVMWPIPPVPGEEPEASSWPRSSASQNETLNTFRCEPAPCQGNPAPVCPSICPYAQAEVHPEHLKVRQQRSFSSLVAEEIPSNVSFHRTIRERQPGSVILSKKDERAPSPEKALGGGEANGGVIGQRGEMERQNDFRQAPSRVNRPPAQEPLVRFALAESERVAGGVLVDLLQQYGDPNPLVGMRTILVALEEAGAPHERLCDLVYLGHLAAGPRPVSTWRLEWSGLCLLGFRSLLWDRSGRLPRP